MTTPALATKHVSNQQLILHALGQGDEDLALHIEMCDACRSQAQAYGSVLAATRNVLGAGSARIKLVSLQKPFVLESTECQVGDDQHTLRVTLSARSGCLHGQLTVDETCTCWYNAPVRLFGPNGLLAHSRIDANREFLLPMPAAGRRYSLGLVLTRHDVAELQIIGSFQVR
jgi:hypothetical protein